MSLSSQHSRNLRKPFGISQSMVCRLLKERKNEILLPAPINTGTKRRRIGKDEKVEIAIKLWLESMQLSGSRISRAVLEENAKDFGRQLEPDFKRVTAG
ncbi:hypothetical protein MXB_1824 [Myxobolus squamalis]|nr:hypothetical protein MXB_1824 [Myxobolus squamalis]